MRRLRNILMVSLALKQFDKNVIRFVWNEIKVPVEIKFGEDVGKYVSNPWRKYSYILIGSNMSKKEFLATLTHENGHALDHQIKGGLVDGKFVGYYDRKYKTQEKEKIAWKYAIVFAKKYNLDICYDSAILWLGSYGVKYRCLENLQKSQGGRK